MTLCIRPQTEVYLGYTWMFQVNEFFGLPRTRPPRCLSSEVLPTCTRLFRLSYPGLDRHEFWTSIPDPSGFRSRFPTTHESSIVCLGLSSPVLGRIVERGPSPLSTLEWTSFVNYYFGWSWTWVPTRPPTRLGEPEGRCVLRGK